MHRLSDYSLILANLQTMKQLIMKHVLLYIKVLTLITKNIPPEVRTVSNVFYISLHMYSFRLYWNVWSLMFSSTWLERIPAATESLTYSTGNASARARFVSCCILLRFNSRWKSENEHMWVHPLPCDGLWFFLFFWWLWGEVTMIGKAVSGKITHSLLLFNALTQMTNQDWLFSKTLQEQNLQFWHQEASICDVLFSHC